MLKYEYIEALLQANKDVPYRTCVVCNTPMFFTTFQFQPHLCSCKCRGSGETALCKMSWEDLRSLLNTNE